MKKSSSALKSVVRLVGVAELEEIGDLLGRHPRDQSFECRFLHRVDVDTGGRGGRERRSKGLIEIVVHVRDHVQLLHAIKGAFFIGIVSREPDDVLRL